MRQNTEYTSIKIGECETTVLNIGGRVHPFTKATTKPEYYAYCKTHRQFLIPCPRCGDIMHSAHQLNPKGYVCRKCIRRSQEKKALQNLRFPPRLLTSKD